MTNRNGSCSGRGLNAKQAAFCREYLIDLNATQAAIRAGYAAKSADVEGSRLLVNAKVRSEIDRLKKERNERLQIKGDDVLRSIDEVVQRCMQAVPVLDRFGQAALVETPGGQVAPAYTFDSRGALKGLELLGKHLKLFTERLEIKDKTNRADRLAKIRARLTSRT